MKTYESLERQRQWCTALPADLKEYHSDQEQYHADFKEYHSNLERYHADLEEYHSILVQYHTDIKTRVIYRFKKNNTVSDSKTNFIHDT